MKTTILIIASIFCISLLSAQVVIEESDLMQPGDTFLIHVDHNPSISIDITTDGADLSWDFSGLTNDESNFACYAPSDDLEFIDEFTYSEFYTYGPGFIYAGPGGGAPLENWGYMMFYTNTNGLFVEGFYSDYGMGYRSTFNTPAELLMFTPANYLDEETNDSYWEVIVDETVETPMNVDTLYRRDVDKQLIADAWGELTTDYGTYEVLRIHETGISIDSVHGFNGATTIISWEVSRDTINNYYFWAKEVKHPILTVHCDYEDNIERIDFLMGAIYSKNNSIKTQNNDKYIYPNPAKDFVNLSGFGDVIFIYNSTGQLIEKINNASKYLNLNISEYASGLFFIKDNIGTCKTLIIK